MSRLKNTLCGLTNFRDFMCLACRDRSTPHYTILSCFIRRPLKITYNVCLHEVLFCRIAYESRTNSKFLVIGLYPTLCHENIWAQTITLPLFWKFCSEICSCTYEAHWKCNKKLCRFLISLHVALPYIAAHVSGCLKGAWHLLFDTRHDERHWQTYKPTRS